jgi:hypothetical protein
VGGGAEGGGAGGFCAEATGTRSPIASASSTKMRMSGFVDLFLGRVRLSRKFSAQVSASQGFRSDERPRLDLACTRDLAVRAREMQDMAAGKRTRQRHIEKDFKSPVNATGVRVRRIEIVSIRPIFAVRPASVREFATVATIDRTRWLQSSDILSHREVMQK